MIEQTAEQKAATMAERCAKKWLPQTPIDFDGVEYPTKEDVIETTKALKDLILNELNLAELVKCKERCEALDSHVIGRSLIGYKDTFDDIKQVLSDLCKENMSLAEERDQLRTKVQELEKDKERLDWLERTQGCAAWDDNGFWSIFTNRGYIFGNNLRTTIDNAREGK